MLTRTLTSLTLVVAQTLSWAGGMLFVCVDEAGAVCIDGGPQDCHCRPSEAAFVKSCCSASATHPHSEAAPSACSRETASLGAAPCDCQHESIAQKAAKASQVRSLAIDHWLHADAWATCVVSAAAHADEPVGPLVKQFLDAANPPLGRNGTVVLRC